MLLQFYCSNFLSFKDEIELNMMPAKSRIMKNHEIVDEQGKSVRALPIATVYGANASGKTNLVKALGFIKELVVGGTRANSSTGVTPFRLSADSEVAHSRFELVFKHDGVVYTYGILVSSREVYQEWLFARYTSQESRVFERLTKDGRVKVEAGPKLEKDAGGAQFIDYVAKGTRPNQPFLTEANDKNIDLIKPVVHWFREHLQIVNPRSRYRQLAMRSDKDREFLDFLSKILRIADTGIEKLEWTTERFEPEKHFARLPETVRQSILDKFSEKEKGHMVIEFEEEILALDNEVGSNGGTTTCRKLISKHARTDGSAANFGLEMESDGTRRLLHLAPMLLDAWERDVVFVIDELDRSLHTRLSRFFIESIISAVSEKGARGQFVMSTHDTNLLDRELLRRDEIWFIEKDEEGSSHLTSLAEYNVNQGLNYENGYLNGRFGAIPFIGDYKQLLM